MERERQLVARVLAGNRPAFEELVRQYQRLVAHVVFRLVPDPADREEVCQDVFLKVYRRLADFRFESRLSTWIARIAYHTALNRLEKRRQPLWEELAPEERRGAELARAGDAPTPLDDAEASELRAFVRAEVDALPPAYRAAITLYHLDGLDVREVAEVMDLPEGTVKSHLFRARKLLKERLLARYGVGEPQP